MAADNKDTSTHSSAAFSFTQANVVHIGKPDIYYGDFEDNPNTFWANNGSGGAHDMGNVPLDSITNAPDKSLGVGVFQYYDDQATDIIVGHTYCVVTRDGTHYAKLQVIDVSRTHIE